MGGVYVFVFFFSSRRLHTRLVSDWSSDVCSSDLDWVLTGRYGQGTKRALDRAHKSCSMVILLLLSFGPIERQFEPWMTCVEGSCPKSVIGAEVVWFEQLDGGLARA